MGILCGKEAFGTEVGGLSNQIEQTVVELDYTQEVAQDFAEMVNGWKDKDGSSIVTIWKEKLADAKQAYEQGRISQTKLADIEEVIIGKLSHRIRKEIKFNEKFFDLADIIKHKQAQCLGYVQLFYVLGNSVGLSVETVNIIQPRTGKLPLGAAHIANVINLANGKVMIVDLVPGGFISVPFVLEERFSKTGDYWQLKNETRSLGLDKKIELLDRDGLIACIYNNHADLYSEQKHYTKALYALAKAINRQPNYAIAYYNRGIIYRQINNIEQAIVEYSKAIGYNPDFAEAYSNRGIMYRNLGKLEQAVCDYTTAIKLNPDIAATYRNRAISYALLGKSEEAKKDLLKAMELNPDFKKQIKMMSQRLEQSSDNPFSSIFK